MSQYRKTLLLVCAILLVTGVSLAQTQANGLRVVLAPKSGRLAKDVTAQEKNIRDVIEMRETYVSLEVMSVTKL
jgi:hypothetical protein